jgi:hypothetical protein
MEARFSASVQTCPRAHPAAYTMGTGSFPGLKRPERGVDHPPPPTPRLKKKYSCPLLPLWAFVACSRVNFTFTLPYFLIQVDHIEMYWYAADFPHSRRQNRGIYHIVGRAFLSPADTTLCLVSPAIVSRLLPLRDGL